MKKILLITTGGTIASLPSGEGLQPSSDVDLLAALGNSASGLEISTLNLMTLDSSNIQPEEWKLIAETIYKNREGYCGIVVAHGTDTMGYTASMVSFMLKNPDLPIVFTGSQLPFPHPLTDAISNLRCAFAMAASGVPGVYVAFDRQIMLGCRAVKVRTTDFSAFESVNSAPVAVINSHGLVFNESIIPRFEGKFELNTCIDTNIFLIKLTPATNPEIIDLLIGSGCHGIVIEAFGAGGLQFIRRDFSSALARASSAGVPVVIVSQCLYESSDMSIYQVGRRNLESGVIEGADMTTEAAVTKLMWARGQTSDLEEIRSIFAKSFTGEISK